MSGETSAYEPDHGWKGTNLVFSLALLLVAFLLYGENFRFSLLGHDTYPIIAAARIQSPSDLAGTFSEELMDGRYVKGHFYRPVLNFSFALDYLLWGLEPWGYHLTDLLILAVSAVLLSVLPPRLAKSCGARAGLLAGLFFIVHPVHLNIVPVPPRRADTLSLLFMLLALFSAAGGGRSTKRFAPALFALLAVGSKETGAVTPLLLFLWRFFCPEVGGRSRFRQALGSSAPSFLALAPFVVARELVIGGMGGHGEVTAASVIRNALLILPEFERITFYPYSSLSFLLPDVVARRSLIALAAFACVFLLRAERERGLALLALCWAFLGWLIHGLSGSIGPWYALHTVLPLSILFGLLVTTGLRGTGDSQKSRRRLPRALLTMPLLFLFAVNLRGVPPFYDHPEWHALTLQSNWFLAELKEKLDATPNGETVTLYSLPFGAKPRAGSPIILAAGLTGYSVQAWTELVYPERKTRVHFGNKPPPPPREDEVVVNVKLGREP